MSLRTLICVPLAVIGLGSIVAFAETDNPVNAVGVVLCGLGIAAAWSKA
jgi:threonine/homoserine efflux transporter RhtA